MSLMSERILKSIKDAGLSYGELHERTGIPKSALQRYATGETEKIPLDRIEAIAKATEVSAAFLMGWEDRATENPLPPKSETAIPPGFEPLPEMQLIPLVGEIACGMPITAEENLDGYVEAPKGRHIDFALTCKGESMVDAGISDGDVVFVRKQPTVENGQIAAVRVNGEATVKRVYINGNAMILQPANINFLPQTYAISELDDVAIEGLVVGWTHWV